MAPKSIFRGPDAKHFAVVHRSQRDPLINDPEAGDRVLYPVERQNEAKARRKNQGQSRKDLESALGSQAASLRPNVGEASMYDIFYDDSEYDYMQHLKPVGQSKEAVLLEKPTLQKEKRNGKEQDGFLLRSEDNESAIASLSDQSHTLIPTSVLATPAEQLLSYKNHLEFALPAHSALADGLLPAINDSSLREILEALEDEEFIEEEANDEFFGQIVKDGERDEDDKLDWMNDLNSTPEPLTDWDRAVGQFKYSGEKYQAPVEEDVDTQSDVSSIDHERSSRSKRKLSVRGSHAGSAFSMSSSAMIRNEGLTGLDDRFDQIEKEYASSDEDSGSESDDSTQTAIPHHTHPQREDFDRIMDDFLEKFEILGGKMKPVLEGKTPLEKLATMRKELLISETSDDIERQLMKERILLRLDEEEKRELNRPKSMTEAVEFDSAEDRRDKWDCESILSTYSNVENHPRVIRICDTIGIGKRPNKVDTKVEIDRLTGFPVVNGVVVRGTLTSQSARTATELANGSDSDSDTDVESTGETSRNSALTRMSRLYQH
ncbi:hypothetical protein CROQUDRAFT_460504 [Cronartium quercuum f. sp. fusiforme G11]|uniref:Uncharacterized protein n=1 Tax=Cronartium quercuum f. sp. fusiforme G11 TaxID=708437 RepID=A0A9P6N8X5_9BASI|nr:hypothetical protein CROQUDRAFT_460504 [Cronartium quercuum f. sp. fusiforme G11]